MEPLPLASSRAVMSAAFSAPAESVELKLAGAVSRSAKPEQQPRRDAIVSVGAEPSMRPLPLLISIVWCRQRLQLKRG